ncbi:heavy-metal-associated domain-containing protein [Tenacibaculum sp. IB213877]|uniref:heavy-metal-associated domain-containing protein n=1 Tax=Tenacibaculum sp. IB213877 TaxID=3097351 RepID=UPI002A5AE32C|nr:MauE/DoxX family redox-associated membrane protein [Tenacibaculum sp. IB213877]MDY0780252.1 cation transporter [Tenacibaculum sp. IB213877]
MKHTYQITGMTCQNCKTAVTEKLLAVDGVTEVLVNLEQGEADITMQNHVDTSILQKALPSKYSISLQKESGEPDKEFTFVDEQKSKIEQLKPLFLILFYISVAGILLNYKNWSWQSFMLDFMGLFFIVFSFFKMLDLKGFPDSFRMYDPLAKKIPIYAKMYPFIETILGLMFLMRFNVQIALIITIVVLGVTTYGVTKTLVDKKSIRCACLGTALNLPMTEATFIENLIMLIMAVLMLI